MNTLLKTLLLIAICPSFAVAQSSYYDFGSSKRKTRTGSTYDWRSGNSQSWNKDASGNTNISGFNSRTGSSWRTTVDPKGNMRGTDSSNNMWSYNRETGTYQNFGTGKICTGKGYARTCN